MPNSEYAVIFITASAGEEADLISKVLVEEGKAACVNIVDGVHSLFRWEGNIESTDESLLIVKAKTSFLEEIIRIVKEIHSNEVPEIIALPIIGGNPDYLAWIDKETL
ncbi:MAG: divalent-cation tolerance protein CutA [Dehalococcoidales bacterium]